MQPVKLQLITMKFFIICSIFTFLINPSSGSIEGDLRESPVACSSDEVACDNTEGNLLDQMTEVPTVDMCRDLCLDIEDCQFFPTSMRQPLHSLASVSSSRAVKGSTTVAMLHREHQLRHDMWNQHYWRFR